MPVIGFYATDCITVYSHLHDILHEFLGRYLKIDYLCADF